MKHDELTPEVFCEIYGHSDTRWLPFVGPPPLPQDEDERPMVLFCRTCETILRRST